MNTGLARNTDPDTSIEAAATINVTHLENQVLSAIKQFGIEGATQDDILAALPNVSHSSITPRFRPLINKGVVIDTGLRRKGKSGKRQRVMRATDVVSVVVY